MILDQTSLVLEGGGLRGIYTSGVLRFLMEKELFFPYTVGVSIGACNACNYISRQPERNRTVNIRFVNDGRYVSYPRLLLKGELFGMDFLFNTIPRKLDPFDFETFTRGPMRFVGVVTDCITGKPHYFDQDRSMGEFLTLLRASCSLPFLAHPVHHGGRIFMDGGFADSIPIKKSMADGNKKHLLVLTRPRGYRKKRSPLVKLARLRYPKFKGLCRAMAERRKNYNKIADLVDDLEDRNEVFVIRPKAPLPIRRAETHKETLHAGYDEGYADAASAYVNLYRYLKK